MSIGRIEKHTTPPTASSSPATNQPRLGSARLKAGTAQSCPMKCGGSLFTYWNVMDCTCEALDPVPWLGGSVDGEIDNSREVVKSGDREIEKAFSTSRPPALTDFR